MIRVLRIVLLDPFGSKLGEGLVNITDEIWYRDLPNDVKRRQVDAMTSHKYGQVDADHPPFQIEMSKP